MQHTRTRKLIKKPYISELFFLTLALSLFHRKQLLKTLGLEWGNQRGNWTPQVATRRGQSCSPCLDQKIEDYRQPQQLFTKEKKKTKLSTGNNFGPRINQAQEPKICWRNINMTEGSLMFSRNKVPRPSIGGRENAITYSLLPVNRQYIPCAQWIMNYRFLFHYFNCRYCMNSQLNLS